MIDLYDFIQALNTESKPTDIINPGASGTASDFTWQTWKVKKGQRFVTCFNLGEMGAGLPYSIGASLATGRRVIHIEGDGGFQLNIQELETIRRLKLNIIMFIINNNGYHSIRLSQMKNFGRLTGADPSSGFTVPELRRIAHGYKLNYMQIQKVSQLPDVFKIKPPLLVEVIGDPEQQYRHRVEFKFVDGKWVNGSN